MSSPGPATTADDAQRPRTTAAPAVPASAPHPGMFDSVTAPCESADAVPGPVGFARADGSVVVPAPLAGEVVRILAAHVDARVRADGGELSPGARRLLVELHTAAHTAPRPAPASAGAVLSSATGSRAAGGGTVGLTVAEAAELMECTPRWIRQLITTGRLLARRAGARMWLIDPADLDRHRHHRQGDQAA